MMHLSPRALQPRLSMHLFRSRAAELWAVFFLAYRLTGITLFRQRAEMGLRALMASYPDWRWTEYISEEQTR
jgi:hypothetical protein